MQCMSVVAYNERLTPDNWEYLNITRPFSIIYYVLSGSAFYTIDGVERPFKKGHLYILPADKTLSLREVEADKFYSVFIHAYTSPKIVTAMEIDVTKDTFLFDVLSLLRKYIPTKNNASVQHLTNLLVSYACEFYQEHAIAFHGKIKEYIEEHFLEVMKGATLSKHFNYSASYITKVFRDEYNLTPKQYATQLVLQKAVALLHENLSINEIAQELLFSSPENFSRFFKNFYGCAPSEYRRTHNDF